ncbi:hypothetical protein AURDEDRAFT_123955 [Auricularia subglabra TFB-10046 SS5]|nr:hypothetical protein AURDEDRAFT_123955 [Auricularia subglabra TFB-10046 SS5]
MSSIAIALLLILLGCSARLVNFTVDDEYGDLRTGRPVEYSSVSVGQANSWHNSSNKVPFHPATVAGLDWDRLQNGTFSLTPSGSAIYVFFVLYSGESTNLTWSLDDIPTDEPFTYKKSTEGQDNGYYTYNQPVFRRNNLSYGHHRAVVSTFPGDENNYIYALFDYAVYTAEEDPNPPRSSTATIGSTESSEAKPTISAPSPPQQRQTQRISAKVIAASLSGGIFIIAGIACCVWLRRKRRRANATVAWSDDRSQPEPYPLDGSGSEKGILMSKPPRQEPTKIEFEKVPPAVPAAPAVLEAAQSQGASDGTTILRAEVERVREENEILRQTAEPLPGYSDGGRSERA